VVEWNCNLFTPGDGLALTNRRNIRTRASLIKSLYR